MVDACRRHRLPLFAVPPDVSFASITAYISNTMANDRVTRVMASLSRQRELLTDVYKGYLLDDLITRTSRELGRPIWVVTATGRHVVDPIEPLPEVDLDLIISTALAAPRLPVTINDSRGERLIVFSIAGIDEHRTTAWFLVVAGDWNEWHPLILDTANELTAVAGLYRVQRHGESGVSNAVVDRLIELVDADAEQPESAIYLRQVGVAPGQKSVDHRGRVPRSSRAPAARPLVAERRDQPRRLAGGRSGRPEPGGCDRLGRRHPARSDPAGAGHVVAGPAPAGSRAG